MATGNSDVVLSLGLDDSAYRAGMRGAADEATRFGRGVGAGVAPANQAFRDLGSTIKNYKAEQSSQARTVSFFVRELTDITGMSKEASSAVGGLGQVMLEAAAGGGAFAIGFEAAKFVATQVVAAFKAAEERTRALEAAQLALNAAVMAGKYAFESLRRGVESDGDKAFRQVFDAGTAGVAKFQEELEKIRPTTWGLVKAFIWDGSVGLKRMQEESDKAAAGLDKILASAKALAEEARAFAEMPLFGPGNDVGAGAFAINSERAAAANKKSADFAREELSYRAKIDAMNKKLIDSVKPIPSEVPSNLTQVERRGFTFDFAPVFGPGNNEGAHRFTEDVKKLNDEGRQTTAIFSSLGDSIGSAFGSFGQMVGGAAGEFMKLVGGMIQQAVQLAISLAAASVAWTSPLGMVAIGAATLAGLLGLIASVPSFDVGTLSVPRTGLAMVHAGETILPAGGPAESYRAGLARSGARGGSTTVNVTVNVNDAVDGQSVYRTLTRSREQLARVVREAVRDGAM